MDLLCQSCGIRASHKSDQAVVGVEVDGYPDEPLTLDGAKVFATSEPTGTLTERLVTWARGRESMTESVTVGTLVLYAVPIAVAIPAWRFWSTHFDPTAAGPNVGGLGGLLVAGLVGLGIVIISALGGVTGSAAPATFRGAGGVA